MLFSERSPTEPRPLPEPKPGFPVPSSQPSTPPSPQIPPPLVPANEGNVHMSWFGRKKSSGPSEGTSARVQAEHTLAEHKKQSKEVHEVVGSLRRLREGNHFTANIRAIWEESIK